MDKHTTETHTFQQIFHYTEQNIETICASLENGMYCVKCYQNKSI